MRASQPVSSSLSRSFHSFAAVGLATTDELNEVWQHIVASSLMAGSGIASLLGARHLRRRQPRRAELHVSDDVLVVQHDGVFTRPLRIPCRFVRVISLDASPLAPGQNKVRGKSKRFPISDANDQWKVTDWLLGRYWWWRPTRIPFFSDTERVPNLLVILNRAITPSALAAGYRVASALDG